MNSYAYYCGEFSPYEDVKIGLFDRAVYFGDGVYDVMVGRNGQVYQMERHLMRLCENAAAIGLDYPVGIEDIIFELIKRSNIDNFSIYIQLSRTAKTRLHAPDGEVGSALLITISECEVKDTPDEIKVTIEEDIRYRMCNIKTINLLPAVLSSIRAKNVGCEEAILVRDGIVTEGSKSNVFALIGSEIYTHPKGKDILPGITRENVFRISERCGLKVTEAKFEPSLLLSADEIFITSTTKFIRRVKKAGKLDVGGRNENAINALYSLLYREFREGCEK